MRIGLVIIMFLALFSMPAAAQDDPTPTPTETQTPTPTPSPTPEPWVYATLLPESTEEVGQTSRFDYIVTVGDVHIANLLSWQLVSQWMQFLFGVLVLGVLWRRR